jgi:hypothetical protein
MLPVLAEVLAAAGLAARLVAVVAAALAAAAKKTKKTARRPDAEWRRWRRWWRRRRRERWAWPQWGHGDAEEFLASLKKKKGKREELPVKIYYGLLATWLAPSPLPVNKENADNITVGDCHHPCFFVVHFGSCTSRATPNSSAQNNNVCLKVW